MPTYVFNLEEKEAIRSMLVFATVQCAVASSDEHAREHGLDMKAVRSALEKIENPWQKS